MRKVRNITVAVDPELYRQTRHLAAEYNTSVTDMVRFLLLAMPEALKAARYSIFRKGVSDALALKLTRPQGASALYTVEPDRVFRKMPYPGGRPQYGIAAARAARAAAAAQTPVQLTAAPSVTSDNTFANPQIIVRPNSSPNSFPASQIAPSTPSSPQTPTPPVKL